MSIQSIYPDIQKKCPRKKHKQNLHICVIIQLGTKFLLCPWHQIFCWLFCLVYFLLLVASPYYPANKLSSYTRIYISHYRKKHVSNVCIHMHPVKNLPRISLFNFIIKNHIWYDSIAWKLWAEKYHHFTMSQCHKQQPL